MNLEVFTIDRDLEKTSTWFYQRHALFINMEEDVVTFIGKVQNLTNGREGKLDWSFQEVGPKNWFSTFGVD